VAGVQTDGSAYAPATVLVLGGTGFVGRNLCAAFRDAGYRVVPVARHSGARVAGCDVRHLDAVRAAPAELATLLHAERPAVVVNASGAVWGVSDDDMTRTNITLVDNLLAALAGLPWRPRLVHLGSVYEYGPQPAGVPVREDAPARPVAHYGRTKLAGTQRVLAACADGLDGVVLRLTTAVGPGAPQQSLFGSIAARLAAGSRTGGPVPLGLPVLRGERDFIDVRDVADAVLAAAGTTATGILNIGRGRLVAVREAVDRLIQVSGVPVTVTAQPASGPRRDVGIGSQPISIDAARRQLCWTPRRDLTDALVALWGEAAGALAATHSSHAGVLR
jgi:NDP-hexose 4-ketoreductase